MTKKEELYEYVRQWKNNPMHWTNGKRHIHGLPVLRKQANKKDRLFPLQEKEFIQKFQAFLEEETIKNIEKSIKQIADIENFKI